MAVRDLSDVPLLELLFGFGGSRCGKRMEISISPLAKLVFIRFVSLLYRVVSISKRLKIVNNSRFFFFPGFDLVTRLILIRFPLDDSTVLPFPSTLTVEISFYLRHFASGEARLLFYEGRYFRVRMFSTLVFTQGESVRGGEITIFSNIVLCAQHRVFKKPRRDFAFHLPVSNIPTPKSRIKYVAKRHYRNEIQFAHFDWSTIGLTGSLHKHTYNFSVL